MTTNDDAEQLTAQEESAIESALYAADKALEDFANAPRSFSWVTRAEAAENAAELQDEAENVLDALNTLIAAIADLAGEADQG